MGLRNRVGADADADADEDVDARAKGGPPEGKLKGDSAVGLGEAMAEYAGRTSSSLSESSKAALLLSSFFDIVMTLGGCSGQSMYGTYHVE